MTETDDSLPDCQSWESHRPHFTDGKTEAQGGEGYFSELGGFLWIAESCSESQDATWAPFRREQNLSRILHLPLQQAHQWLYYLDRPFPLSEPQLPHRQDEEVGVRLRGLVFESLIACDPDSLYMWNADIPDSEQT